MALKILRYEQQRAQIALKKVEDLKNKDLSNEILNFHKDVEENSTLATHYKSYRIYDDVSLSDSINNLFEPGILLKT